MYTLANDKIMTKYIIKGSSTTNKSNLRTVKMDLSYKQKIANWNSFFSISAHKNHNCNTPTTTTPK